MQTDKYCLPNVMSYVVLCSNSVVQKLLTGFVQGSRWMEGCSRWVERRAGGEEKGEESGGCGCREEWLQSFKSSFAYLCLSGGSPLSLLSFLSFTSFSPLPSPCYSTLLLNLFRSFSQPLYLLVSDFIAPFMAFDFDFDSPSSTFPPSLSPSLETVSSCK